MFKRITWEPPVSFYMLLCRQYLSMMQGFPATRVQEARVVPSAPQQQQEAGLA